MPVSYLILHDEHRADVVLFGADDGRKVGVEKLLLCVPMKTPPCMLGEARYVVCGAVLWPYCGQAGAGYAYAGSLLSLYAGEKIRVSVSRMQAASAMPPSWLRESFALR